MAGHQTAGSRQRILVARGAVKPGVEAAHCFDLSGYRIVTQKLALLGQRNPGLPDVTKRFPVFPGLLDQG